MTSTRHLRTIKGVLFAAGLFAGCLSSGAVTSEWATAVSGTWTNPACWVGGTVPTVYTNDISINVSGTYTSQWMNNLSQYNNNQATNVGAISVGVTTGGVQTLVISGNAYENAGINGPITVGSNGVFEQQMALTSISSTSLAVAATVNIHSGGVYRSIGVDAEDRRSDMGPNRVLNIDAGGALVVSSGSAVQLGLSVDNAGIIYTNNGVITGAGMVEMGSGRTMRLVGSGTVDGPGKMMMWANTTLYLGGTLAFNRNFGQLSTNTLGDVYFMNGANITLDGNLVVTNASGAFYLANNAIVTVSGRGVVDLKFNSPTSYFGGHSWTVQPTAMTLTGTGTLVIRTDGNTVYMNPGLFTLSRTGTVYDAGGTFRIEGGRSMIIGGTGGYFTMGAGTTLHIEPPGSSSYVRIRNGGSLSLAGARVEGNAVGDPYALHFSDDKTAANLILSAGTTNAMAGMATNQTLSVRLGTNAVVVAGTGSMLTLSDAVLHVAMTNSAAWGWSAQGTLGIGANVQLEALSLDHGYHVNVAAEPFSINSLAFTADNATLTLANSAGNAKRALYVRTLNLGALSPGSTVDLQGFSGAERVYYSNLINPKGVTFVTPAEWVAIPSVGTMLTVY